MEKFARILKFAALLKVYPQRFVEGENECRRITAIARSGLRLIELDPDVLSVRTNERAIHHAVLFHKPGKEGGLVLEPQTGELMTMEEALVHYEKLFNQVGKLSLTKYRPSKRQ